MRVIERSMFGVMLVLAACTTSATDASTSSGVSLRVAVWDYTEKGMTEQPTVELRGGGDAWLPEMNRRFNRHIFSGLERGTTQTFVFEPFGNDRLQVPVDVPITDALCPSGCVPDTLHFEIRDDRIRVWGVVEARIVDRPDHEYSRLQPPVQIRLSWGQ